MKKTIITLLFPMLALIVAPLQAEEKSEIPPQNIEVSVKGMVCDFCARGLEKVFAKQKAVESTSISLETGKVTLVMKKDQNLGDKKITKLINDNGISVEKIQRGANVLAPEEKK